MRRDELDDKQPIELRKRVKIKYWYAVDLYPLGYVVAIVFALLMMFEGVLPYIVR